MSSEKPINSCLIKSFIELVRNYGKLQQIYISLTLVEHLICRYFSLNPFFTAHIIYIIIFELYKIVYH